MKKIFSFTFLLVALLAFSATSAFAAVDQYEPANDEYVTAPVAANDNYYGQGHAYYGLATANNVDYFRFTTIGGGLQNILFIPPDNQSYVVAVIEGSDFADGSTSSITAAITNGSAKQLQFYPKPNTEYAVMIFGLGGAHNDTDPYTLIVSQYR